MPSYITPVYDVDEGGREEGGGKQAKKRARQRGASSATVTHTHTHTRTHNTTRFNITQGKENGRDMGDPPTGTLGRRERKQSLPPLLVAPGGADACANVCICQRPRSITNVARDVEKRNSFQKKANLERPMNPAPNRLTGTVTRKRSEFLFSVSDGPIHLISGRLSSPHRGDFMELPKLGPKAGRVLPIMCAP